ncbi:unnamed protein product [Cuscuta campestris]|uniref:Uncharacterized protein n=1 Tax=Cuscuta campestris TaxID=132261 RepID=A0A484LB12_9ASTE|nr:unnamed protein product [Cuscuta campestris]
MTDQEFDKYLGGKNDANLLTLEDIFEEVEDKVEPTPESPRPLKVHVKVKKIFLDSLDPQDRATQFSQSDLPPKNCAARIESLLPITNCHHHFFHDPRWLGSLLPILSDLPAIATSSSSSSIVGFHAPARLPLMSIPFPIREYINVLGVHTDAGPFYFLERFARFFFSVRPCVRRLHSSASNLRPRENNADHHPSHSLPSRRRAQAESQSDEEQRRLPSSPIQF